MVAVTLFPINCWIQELSSLINFRWPFCDPHHRPSCTSFLLSYTSGSLLCILSQQLQQPRRPTTQSRRLHRTNLDWLLVPDCACVQSYCLILDLFYGEHPIKNGPQRPFSLVVAHSQNPFIVLLSTVSFQLDIICEVFRDSFDQVLLQIRDSQNRKNSGIGQVFQ